MSLLLQALIVLIRPASDCSFKQCLYNGCHFISGFFLTLELYRYWQKPVGKYLVTWENADEKLGHCSREWFSMYYSHLIINFSSLGIEWEAVSILWCFLKTEACVSFFVCFQLNKAITVTYIFFQQSHYKVYLSVRWVISFMYMSILSILLWMAKNIHLFLANWFAFFFWKITFLCFVRLVIST